MLPSGEQLVLEAGGHRVTVVEVGGGLRSWTLDGLDVLDGYAEDEVCPAGRGQVLLPWPNRLPGGRWSWRGVEQQLPLDEVPTGAALHGLVRWLPWRLARESASAAAATCRLHPQPGWPGTLDCVVRYELGAEGLTVLMSVTNAGGDDCPVALGMHPYWSTHGPADDARLTVPAQSVRRSGETADSALGDLDLREERPLGATRLDDTFTGLRRDADGRAHAVLRTSRLVVDVWCGPELEWLQAFTGDEDPVPARRRRSVALEPMTAPPGALATGEGLRVLSPGESFRASWGARVTRASAG